jgi:hypothetical protein
MIKMNVMRRNRRTTRELLPVKKASKVTTLEKHVKYAAIMKMAILFLSYYNLCLHNFNS